MINTKVYNVMLIAFPLFNCSLLSLLSVSITGQLPSLSVTITGKLPLAAIDYKMVWLADINSKLW